MFGQFVEQRRYVGNRGVDVDAIAGACEANTADDRTVEGNDARTDLVDEDLDRQRTDRSIVDPYDGRRTTGPTVGLRRFLDHQTETLELGDESGNGAAREPGRPHEARARAWASTTHLIEHQRQIRTPQMWRSRGAGHGFATYREVCHTCQQTCVSTGAMRIPDDPGRAKHEQ